MGEGELVVYWRGGFGQKPWENGVANKVLEWVCFSQWLRFAVTVATDWAFKVFTSLCQCAHKWLVVYVIDGPIWSSHLHKYTIGGLSPAHQMVKSASIESMPASRSIYGLKANHQEDWNKRFDEEIKDDTEVSDEDMFYVLEWSGSGLEEFQAKYSLKCPAT
ncbi:hypothetical protein Tco_0446335 [Tanacetum coccineum]